MFNFNRMFRKKEGLSELMERYHKDPQFRAQLESDFEATISPYDLSSEERQTVRDNVGKKRENYAEKALREIWNKYKDQI